MPAPAYELDFWLLGAHIANINFGSDRTGHAYVLELFFCELLNFNYDEHFVGTRVTQHHITCNEQTFHSEESCGNYLNDFGQGPDLIAPEDPACQVGCARVRVSQNMPGPVLEDGFQFLSPHCNQQFIGKQLTVHLKLVEQRIQSFVRRGFREELHNRAFQLADTEGAAAFGSELGAHNERVEVRPTVLAILGATRSLACVAH